MSRSAVFRQSVSIAGGDNKISLRCEGQGQQCFLFYFVRFGAAGGGAGAGAAFYTEDGAVAGDAFQAGEHVKERAHVGGLFLHPDDVVVLAVAVEFGDDFSLGKRVELLQKDDSGGSVFSFLAFGLEFVADLSGADENAVGLSDFGIGDDVAETLMRKVCNRRTGMGMAQHALGRKDDEGLAPVAQGLAAGPAKILR